MWILKQIMEGGAMGVQITISGKLRGDRSAFEKHTVGILPRAGHHAEMIVDEDIAHVGTAMGRIGIRIRIAKKEKLIPEFEMIKEKVSKNKQSENGKVDESKKTKVEESKKTKVEESKKTKVEEPKKTKVEEVKVEEPKKTKVEEVKVEEPKKTKVEEVVVDDIKVEVVKVEGKVEGVKSETEQIAKDEEKMKDLTTNEDEENALK
jgi:small subunit ribosomal protein S3